MYRNVVTQVQNFAKKFMENGYSAPLLFAVVLISSCIVKSGKKYMWLDEILTYYPVSLPFNEMLSFITDKINVGHYLYFIIGWGWAHVFSNSEVSLRLFSSLGFCVGMFFVWAILHRTYGFWSSTISVFTISACSLLIVYQNTEARFYGMFFALTAAFFYVTVRYLQEKKFNLPLASVLFLLSGCLPLVHPFGFAYSLLFIGATVLIDLQKKQFRWWYYLSSISGWLLFVPFIPAFKKALELSKPHFWIFKPDIADLTFVYTNEYRMALVFLGACAVAVICRFIAPVEQKLGKNNHTLLFLGVVFTLFPVYVYLYSQYFSSLFEARYLIIKEIGYSIFMAAILSRLLPSDKKLTTLAKMIILVGITFVFILSINDTFKSSLYVVYTGEKDFELPVGVPVVTENALVYLPRSYYQNSLHREYYYVSDKEAAFHVRNTYDSPHNFQVMQALERHIKSGHILTTEALLETVPEFIVMDSPVWFPLRIMHNSAFTYIEIKPGTYLVHKAPL